MYTVNSILYSAKNSYIIQHYIIQYTIKNGKQGRNENVVERF